MKKIYQEIGMPDFIADFIVHLETMSASGEIEIMNDVVEKVTGQPPKSFDTWVMENVDTWRK